MKTRFNPLQPAAPAPTPPALPNPKPRQNTPKKKTTTKRDQRPPVDAAEALARAANGQSLANYPAIFEGFALKGIPADQIKPRENVFTYDAWRALGRTVRRGEHGVRVVTMVPCGKAEDVDPETGEVRANVRTRPWRSTVFHISQTDPIETSPSPVRTKEVPGESLISANALQIARLPETAEAGRAGGGEAPDEPARGDARPTLSRVPVAFTPPTPTIPVMVRKAETLPEITPQPATSIAAPAAVGGWRARFLKRA